MSWKQFLSFVVMVGTVAISLTGCRNQCGQNFGAAPFQQQQPYYGQPVQQPYYGQPVQQQPFFNQQPIQQPGFNAPVFNGSTSRSQLIPPPATGTLTIPSIARNNPYGLNQNRGLLNTNQAAPTPANRSARFNLQNGWHGIEGAQSGQSPLNTNSTGSTTIASNSASQPNVAPTSVLVASTQAGANQGYGDSYLRSPDYSTTSTNETQDGTRLPATDASAVRAPSQFYARATGVQIARIPQQPVLAAPQPYYSGTFRTAAAQPYQVAGVQNGLFAANQSPVVLDQGTATYDPYGDTRSADWRNRDSSGTFQ